MLKQPPNRIDGKVQPIFKSSDESMRALLLLASLLKGVEGSSVRSYSSDLVRCLHSQICDTKDS